MPTLATTFSLVGRLLLAIIIWISTSGWGLQQICRVFVNPTAALMEAPTQVEWSVVRLHALHATIMSNLRTGVHCVPVLISVYLSLTDQSLVVDSRGSSKEYYGRPIT